MKIAFLFAGQGSQKTGMGKDFYENRKEFAEILNGVNLDFDIKELMFQGPEEQLSKTRYTQPCMAAFLLLGRNSYGVGRCPSLISTMSFSSPFSL